MVGDRTASIRRAWDERQGQLGNTERSVLYKNLPAFTNARLHRRHVRFIRDYLPRTTRTVLDVGCGYGRLAKEIVQFLPQCEVSGVEPCAAFAEEFRKNFRECFVETVEDYQPTTTFDAIVIVTVLMYVDVRQLDEVLLKYWQALNPRGVLICIEQCWNVLITASRMLHGSFLRPTGGDVTYFTPPGLRRTLLGLPNAELLGRASFGLLPLVNRPRLHEGFSLVKLQ
jgi:SAM-dependent methyltransferase